MVNRSSLVKIALALKLVKITRQLTHCKNNLEIPNMPILFCWWQKPQATIVWNTVSNHIHIYKGKKKTTALVSVAIQCCKLDYFKKHGTRVSHKQVHQFSP